MNFESTFKQKNSSLTRAAFFLLFPILIGGTAFAQQTKWPGSMAGKAVQDTTAKNAANKKALSKSFQKLSLPVLKPMKDCSTYIK